MKDVFLSANNVLMNAITMDIYRVKTELKKRDIRVEQIDRGAAALHYSYWYKGYENRFSLMKEVVKSEIPVRLARYIQELNIY